MSLGARSLSSTTQCCSLKQTSDVYWWTFVVILLRYSSKYRKMLFRALGFGSSSYNPSLGAIYFQADDTVLKGYVFEDKRRFPHWTSRRSSFSFPRIVDSVFLVDRSFSRRLRLINCAYLRSAVISLYSWTLTINISSLNNASLSRCVLRSMASACKVMELLWGLLPESRYSSHMEFFSWIWNAFSCFFSHICTLSRGIRLFERWAADHHG